jgi:hypothetical protein
MSNRWQRRPKRLPRTGVANDLDIDFNRFGEAQKIEKHLPSAETPKEAFQGRRS